MGSWGGFRTIVVAVGVSLVGVPVASANPMNDDRTHPIALYSPDSSLEGVRNVATDSSLFPVFSLPLTNTTDAGDPPFVKPLDSSATGSTCKDRDQLDDTGRATLWYEIVAGRLAEPFRENTLITIDTANTSFRPNALAVYEGSIPAAFDGVNPPINLIACDKGTTTVPAQVSFIAHGTPATAKPEDVRHYFVEVGSLSGGGSLSLFIRTFDIQAPTVGLTVKSDNGGLLPDLGASTHFTLTAEDNGSGLPPSDPIAGTSRSTSWDVRFNGQELERAADCIAPKEPPRAGTWCLVSDPEGGLTDADSLIVHWPRRSGKGRVSVSVRDAVGNSTPAGYLLEIHPRTRPRVSGRVSVRGTTATLASRCSRHGSMAIVVSLNGKEIRTYRVKVRPHRSVRRTLHNLRPGFYLVQQFCTDEFKNQGFRYLAFSV